MIPKMIDHWQKKVCIAQACRVLGVSRSGYYAALRRPNPERAICATTTHLKAAFKATGSCYGSRRLATELADRGFKIGRYKVRRLMRQAQIKPVWKQKFVNTTDSKHTLPIAENKLNRQFNPAQPNQAWTSDITYIRTRSGWVYLAVVMDLCSRKIIGWAMDSSMPAELVCRALTLAVGQRKPLPGVIIHSDRGSQYARHEYQQLLKQHGMICSMSRKANCWENKRSISEQANARSALCRSYNAVMERFFLNLRMERVWQRNYANHAEAIQDITEYIVGFYNPRRLHSALGNLSPLLYETKIAVKNLVQCPKILDHYTKPHQLVPARLPCQRINEVRLNLSLIQPKNVLPNLEKIGVTNGTLTSISSSRPNAASNRSQRESIDFEPIDFFGVGHCRSHSWYARERPAGDTALHKQR